MAFKVADRVQETSTTTGTGTYSLDGAATGFQAFSVLGAGATTSYFATDDTNWEVGIGTVATGPATLARTTILASSNSGSAVNWGSGTRRIYCSMAASVSPRKEYASRSSNTILGAGDDKLSVRATSGFTQTFAAVATLADGWSVDYRIDSGATVVFDPNSTETIDGASTLSVVGPASLTIKCNGSALYTHNLEQPASDTVAGKIEIAVQSEMETGSDTTRAVAPGRQHYHPSAAKAWGSVGVTGNVLQSYNVSSVTDNGAGDAIWNWTTANGSGPYSVAAIAQTDASYFTRVTESNTAAGSSRTYVADTSGINQDPNRTHIVAFGDLA